MTRIAPKFGIPFRRTPVDRALSPETTMTFRTLFLDHPESIGESYAEHLGHALSFAGALAICALACGVAAGR
jgi:hypothetical protein